MAAKGTGEGFSKIIEQNKLEVADIVVCHHKHSILSRLIMYGTKSFWSHAALIFVIRNENAGFDNSFVIESVRDGVEISNLRDYLDDVDHYDVGIKRLEKTWFANAQEGLQIRETVRGRMLDSIKAKYDTHTIMDLAATIVGNMVFGTRVAFLGLEKAIKRTHRKNSLVPSRFICSGFVQYALYTTVRDLVLGTKVSLAELEAVNFNPGLRAYTPLTELPMETLLATTPDNIARAESTTWKYLVKDGRVYEVSSQAEVDSITKQGPTVPVREMV
jgi:hypothetical protein